jgi:hypothetical protein
VPKLEFCEASAKMVQHGISPIYTKIRPYFENIKENEENVTQSFGRESFYVY